MKADYVNIFIRSLIMVYEMMLGDRPVMKETFKKTSTTSLLDVAVVIGITGQLKGQVIINFSSKTGQNMASIMMGGVAVLELDEIGKSALQEIGNMMMGTASTELSQLGITTDITPPHMIVGEHMSMTAKDKTIVISFDSSAGKLLLEISIEG